MASTYTVKKGDTLSEIAVTYKTTIGSSLTLQQRIDKLVSLNDIDDPNLIIVGQVLRLTGSAAPVAKKSNSSKVTIKLFGLQSNTDDTVFVSWKWDKDNTDHYIVKWHYDTGDGVWFLGSESSDVKVKHATYGAPSNAKRARVSIKPVSKTHKVKGKDTNYWTADWSEYKVYNFRDNPPATPSAPSVSINKYTLTAELNNITIDATAIQFQVVQNDKTFYKSGTAQIKTNAASCLFSISAGSKYKVRCRAYRARDREYSAWSEYSSDSSTIPTTPSQITVCKATSETSVHLEWPKSTTATSYDIEYATEKKYLATTSSNSETETKTGITTTKYEMTGLESGKTYFFRVRATNDVGSSGWSKISQVTIGKRPAAPTTWSSTTTCISGEQLILYWVHNTEDGSSQTKAELELIINGIKTVKTITNTTDEDEKDRTSSYTINTSSYTEGSVIKWRVRTAGVTNLYGDWSIQRTVDVYAPPTLNMRITNIDGDEINTVEAFPIYIYALAGPNTQAPINYHVSVVSNDTYETVDQIGNTKIVSEGDEIYSKYFNTSEALLLELSASNIDLQNNVKYTVKCMVTMNSGLTGEDVGSFTVSWEDAEYEPNAEILYDDETYVCHIRPYCEYYRSTVYQVTYDSITDEYTKTTTVINDPLGSIVPGAYTNDGYEVYSGTLTDESSVYYCFEYADELELVPNVTLSVYRREFDSSFVELATGIENLKNTFITDPHPSLDYARYRVVAIEKTTGAVSYYDLPGAPIGESAVIIQWDESWTSFDPSSNSEIDELDQPPWSGSLLRLPYNIKVSDKYSADSSLIKYIGRKRPVSYYGTQLGETSSWSVDIDKDDEETLYALRRLAIWMGDVYVREPSGSGYWASIKVSFNQGYDSLTIPVTFEVTRVEGTEQAEVTNMDEL